MSRRLLDSFIGELQKIEQEHPYLQPKIQWHITTLNRLHDNILISPHYPEYILDQFNEEFNAAYETYRRWRK